MHKAPGLDGVNVRMTKKYRIEISPMLAMTLNKSLGRCNVPDNNRQVNISQSFKQVKNTILLVIGMCWSHASVTK